MRKCNGFGAAMIALVVGFGGFTFSPTEVQAQSLLERILRGSDQRYREREAVQRTNRAHRAHRANRAKRAVTSGSRRQQVQTPRITGPTYKTYRPDALVKVDFSQLSDPVITAATGKIGLPRLGMDPFAEGRPTLDELSIKALPEAAKAIVELYSAEPRYLWVSGTGITESAREAIAVLEDAVSVGLDPADYAVTVPADGFDATAGVKRQQELMRFEMSLSAAVADYILDAHRGRIDPNRISGYHDFKRKTPDLVRALEAVANSDEAGAALYGFNPQGTHFAALVEELKRLEAADDGRRVTIAGDLLLRPGQSSPELPNVVEAIRLKGSEELKAGHGLVLASYVANEEYDPDLVALVKDFQKESGLAPDGIVGPRTVRAMIGDTNAAKIEKVKLAMERARWLPGELAERRVFINQPAFAANYYEKGKLAFATRTVVGTKANQTYFFDDEIETVEFNPSWGVPQSIIINEMLPRLRKDPSYLDRLGYQVTYKGRAVSSRAVNWWSVRPGTVGVRQPPGDDNALGKLKILFPNSHAIYMHDTPSKSLFEKDMRAFSHGCVRLQDPRGMASRVLGVSVDEVVRYIAEGRNKAVQVPEKIPVHVAYFTAWPKEDGSVGYFEDVYGRDAYLQKAIEATRNARAAAS